jgi:hypothetical protein
MMANHPAHNGDVTEEELEAVDQLSGAVQDCLARRERLRTVIADLYAAQLRGEAVQDDLDALFEDDEALLAVAGLADQGLLEELLEKATDHDCLTADERDAFEALWADINWIAPAASGYEAARSDDPAYWTDKDVQPVAANGKLVIDHSLAFGVDTVHDIRVPAWKFFVDAVQRLQYVSQLLPTAIEKGDIEAEELANVLETRDDLLEVADQLDELDVQQLSDDGADPADRPEGGAADDSDGSDPVGAGPADDPELPGEDQDRSQETDERDPSDTASVGFQ